MTNTLPWHSVLATDRHVYHDDTRCPDGSRIENSAARRRRAGAVSDLRGTPHRDAQRSIAPIVVMTLAYATTANLLGAPLTIEVRSERGRLVGMIRQAPDGRFQFFKDVLALPGARPTHAETDVNRLKQWLATHRDET